MPKSHSNVTIKPNFLSWLHKYRTKIALFLFFVFTPILLIILGYLSPYLQSTRVTFDLEISEDSEYIRKFKSIDDLEDITLYVDWEDLTKPMLNETGDLFGGSMSFRITYRIENNKDINDVSVTAVLQPLYMNSRDVLQPRILFPFGTTTSNTIFTLSHNVTYPFQPLFLITVTDPILYLRITYNEVLSDRVDPIQVTEYVRIPLKDLYPARVN